MVTEIPQVVTKEQLLGLDKDGRPCEICGGHMHDHNWVVLDPNGFVILCGVMYVKRTITKE